MDNLFLLLFLASFICLIVGLIKPSALARLIRIKLSRKKIFIIFGAAIIIFPVLFGMTNQATDTSNNGNTNNNNLKINENINLNNNLNINPNPNQNENKAVSAEVANTNQAVNVNQVKELTLDITQPKWGDIIKASQVELKGRVDSQDVEVKVNGNKAGVAADGSFGIMVDLKEVGDVHIEVIAKKGKLENKKTAYVIRLLSSAEEAARERETTITDYSQRYCDKRKNNYRKFPKITFEDNIIKWDFDNGIKGVNLKLENCRTNIEALVDMMEAEQGNIDKDTLDRIVDVKYWIGMREYCLAASLGSPNDINETALSGYKQKQYVYNKDSYGISAYYIYVENGKVTSYQDF